MKKSNRFLYFLPIPIIGCFVEPESWQTLLFITARVWINLNAVNLIVKALEAINRDIFGWNHCLILLRSRRLLSAVGTTLLLKCFGEVLADQHTLPFVIVHCLCRIADMEEKEEQLPINTTIGYGVGMACSFFEGYLAYILPNHGTKFYGFEEVINLYESKHTVRFPVKKLFLVITKSLYSPPCLKDFNKTDKRLPHLEACVSLEEQIRDVAGVKGRSYKNSAYMIHRPGQRPVYLAAECATPLHTLHKVKERSAVYEELAETDFDRIVSDFCSMLESILEKNRECHRKCVLVHFDDTDPKQNLAEVLLQKIEEIEPNFEELMRTVE